MRPPLMQNGGRRRNGSMHQVHQVCGHCLPHRLPPRPLPQCPSETQQLQPASDAAATCRDCAPLAAGMLRVPARSQSGRCCCIMLLYQSGRCSAHTATCMPGLATIDAGVVDVLSQALAGLSTQEESRHTDSERSRYRGGSINEPVVKSRGWQPQGGARHARLLPAFSPCQLRAVTLAAGTAGAAHLEPCGAAC